MLKEIIELAKKHGWKEQICGITGFSGSSGTNFYKDGKVLTASMVEEGHMIYPDDDELKEMFGEATFRVYIKNTECDKNEPVSEP